MTEEVDSEVEARRQAALERYEITSTPPDGAFDNITRLAAQVFDVPICVISIVDEDRIWFKSRHGIDAEEIPRDPGLCASVIFNEKAYVIENAVEDVRTLTNPLVTGELGLRFYAGAPLLTHDGFGLGSMAIIDFAPRSFSTEEEEKLQHFAAIVMDAMELRLSARTSLRGLMKIFDLTEEIEELEQYLTVCAWTKTIKIGEEWLTFDQFLRDRLGLMISHGIHPEAAEEILSLQRAKKEKGE